MVRQLTSRAQVNGYRFLIRRAEHALLRRDARMLHDPMRAQWRAAVTGAVIAALVLAGCGIYGLISPSGSVGDARILLSRAGGSYVLVDGTLHPVLNLASARLIVGSAEAPKVVGARALADLPRGPVLGIPGAPDALAAPADPAVSRWAVCEETAESPAGADALILTVVAGAVDGDEVGTVPDDAAVLVSTGDDRHLLYQHTAPDGQRSPVRARLDTAAAPVLRALGLEDAVARPISVGLLNTFPAVGELTVPRLPDRGRPGPTADFRVGTVLRAAAVDGRPAYHVVLADGVAPIGEPAAALLQAADPATGAQVLEVTPAVVTGLPRSAGRPLAHFPAAQPRLLSAGTEPTLCRSWARESGAARATERLLAGRGLPLPPGATPVPVVTGGAGAADAVFVPAGSGEYVAVTGSEPDSRRVESRYYISDFGVRFGIADDETAQVLGLAGSPAPAPWPVLSLLVTGPRLTAAAAFTAHEGVVDDPAAIRPAARPPG